MFIKAFPQEHELSFLSVFENLPCKNITLDNSLKLKFLILEDKVFIVVKFSNYLEKINTVK